ncbi:MAG: hypothetical protein SF052_26905 [Bacteroidia bacterium]|nr:hypothetical protein [Bacteroidia bacterium]
MSIREILLKDIQDAPHVLLQPLYEVWKVLKMQGSRVQNSPQNRMSRYFGVISSTEAAEIRKAIDEEFGKIEGEW